jgi:hypothetical protein
MFLQFVPESTFWQGHQSKIIIKYSMILVKCFKLLFIYTSFHYNSLLILSLKRNDKVKNLNSLNLIDKAILIFCIVCSLLLLAQFYKTWYMLEDWISIPRSLIFLFITIFRLGLGSTYLITNGYKRLFLRGKFNWGLTLTTHIELVLRSEMHGDLRTFGV